MERTNIWAKRAYLRDTRDSGDMKSESITRLNPHIYNGNGYEVQKYFLYIFLCACL